MPCMCIWREPLSSATSGLCAETTHMCVSSVCAGVPHAHARGCPDFPFAALTFPGEAPSASPTPTRLPALPTPPPPCPSRQVFNVNVPNSDPAAGPGPSHYAVTTLGVVNYVGDTLMQKDPGSNVYYLSGQPAYADIAGSDCVAGAGVRGLTHTCSPCRALLLPTRGLCCGWTAMQAQFSRSPLECAA
jgi:hypothetical protein